MTEVAIVDGIKRQDRTVFNDFMSSYEAKIYSYCMAMLDNENDAEEVTQEVFLSVYNNIYKFKGQSSLMTWVYRIAANGCKSMLRKRSVRNKFSLFFPEDSVNQVPAIVDLVQDSERKESVQELHDALQDLKPSHRQIIVLIELHEMKYEAAANILKIPMGTVKSRLTRAKDDLKKIMKSKGV